MRTYSRMYASQLSGHFWRLFQPIPNAMPTANPSDHTQHAPTGTPAGAPGKQPPAAPEPSWPLRTFLRLYAPIAMLIGLGTMAALCLGWVPFALLIGLLPLPGTMRRRIGRGMIFVGMRFYIWVLRLLCFVRVDVRALEAVRHERSIVIIANHPSLIDAVLFMAYLPNTVCVMKAALQNNILYGAATRLAHYVSNASPLHMIRQAGDELQRGAHVLIFPESTRTTRFPVNPSCSPACALMAQRSNTAIQEIFIDMNVPYLGKQWPLFKPPALPWRITLHAGQRIDPSQHTAAEIAAMFEQNATAHFDDKHTQHG